MSERLTQITLVEKDILELLPGEMTCDTSRKHWFECCPECKMPGALHEHTVIENDGIVTVSPSILCSCGAHYYIKNNRIEWV